MKKTTTVDSFTNFKYVWNVNSSFLSVIRESKEALKSLET